MWNTVARDSVSSKILEQLRLRCCDCRIFHVLGVRCLEISAVIGNCKSHSAVRGYIVQGILTAYGLAIWRNDMMVGARLLWTTAPKPVPRLAYSGQWRRPTAGKRSRSTKNRQLIKIFVFSGDLCILSVHSRKGESPTLIIKPVALLGLPKSSDGHWNSKEGKQPTRIRCGMSMSEWRSSVTCLDLPAAGRYIGHKCVLAGVKYERTSE